MCFGQIKLEEDLGTDTLYPDDGAVTLVFDWWIYHWNSLAKKVPANLLMCLVR